MPFIIPLLKSIFATKSGIIPLIISTLIMIVVIIIINQTTDLGIGYQALIGVAVLTLGNIGLYVMIRKGFCAMSPLDKGCMYTKGLSLGLSGAKAAVTRIMETPPATQEELTAKDDHPHVGSY